MKTQQIYRYMSAYDYGVIGMCRLCLRPASDSALAKEPRASAGTVKPLPLSLGPVLMQALSQSNRICLVGFAHAQVVRMLYQHAQFGLKYCGLYCEALPSLIEAAQGAACRLFSDPAPPEHDDDDCGGQQRDEIHKFFAYRHIALCGLLICRLLGLQTPGYEHIALSAL